MEAMGGNIATALTRENVIYQGSFFKQRLDDAMALYTDTVFNPRITDDEIEETKSIIEWEHSQRLEKPKEIIIPDLLHQAAYGLQGLGLPLSDPESARRITRNQILEFRDTFYRPENVVIAGLGYEHELIHTLAEKYFGHIPASATNGSKKSPSTYQGGLLARKAKSEYTHLLVGFESPAFTHRDIYAVSVLRSMLGGGDSFSAGGPGKGMYSRLYTNVLNQYYWVETILADNISYADSGLFSLHAAVPSKGISHILNVIGVELRRILENPIDPEELNRAKNQLRCSLFMNLETLNVHLEDLGRQTQMHGHRISPKEMSQHIEDVTSDDIRRVLGRMVLGRLSYAVYGETKHMPDVRKFEGQFGFGVRASKL